MNTTSTGGSIKAERSQEALFKLRRDILVRDNRRIARISRDAEGTWTVQGQHKTVEGRSLSLLLRELALEEGAQASPSDCSARTFQAFPLRYRVA